MSEACPQYDTTRLTEKLRERLQEMTAASQALSSNLAGNEKAASYLAILDRAICTQLCLVRQLELGQQLYTQSEVRVIFAPMDLVELGRDVMKRADALTRPLLGIKAEFSSSLAALPTQADRAVLEKMLLLFLSNSVRAIGRNGTIRLELEQQRDQAVFTMTDTGGGLDPDALADLFDPLAEPEAPARGLLLASGSPSSTAAPWLPATRRQTEPVWRCPFRFRSGRGRPAQPIHPHGQRRRLGPGPGGPV